MSVDGAMERGIKRTHGDDEHSTSSADAAKKVEATEPPEKRLNIAEVIILNHTYVLILAILCMTNMRLIVLL